MLPLVVTVFRKSLDSTIESTYDMVGKSFERTGTLQSLIHLKLDGKVSLCFCYCRNCPYKYHVKPVTISNDGNIGAELSDIPGESKMVCILCFKIFAP